MVSGRQIRAARGLLGWDATMLADRADMTRETVYRIESDAVQPQERTLNKIVRVFDLHGVEFTPDEGVRIRKNQVRVFSGKEGYKQFLDHIYDVMKNGGRIRQFNLSDAISVPAGDYGQMHLERMGKIQNLDARVLTIEGDHVFPAAYCVYRWLRKENQTLMPFYVYNDFIEMPLSRSSDNIEVISLQSKLLTDRFLEQFDVFWETALIPS